MSNMSYQGSKWFKDWCAFRAVSLSMGYRLLAEGKGPRLTYVGIKPTVTAEADRDWIIEREAEALERRKAARDDEAAA
jgi:hypothetical protein